ncbi:universal stress protein [Noviherbaspirillum pedocola]|uniref:Universal stress protein n=1 Tax=Noviherbaspirillum pedocola TaxID=2801341 RepID=A0A934W968_9BURK|nr:universal stress protein [Noviherbaspirillum pedocola]MBK4737698.1 universal stress protein [Noviherbaspirillum pedocola]
MNSERDAASSSWDTLLLATDGSPASDAATNAAIALGKPLGARIVALSVAEPYPDCLQPLSEGYEHAAVRAAEGHAMRAAAAIRAAGLECEMLVLKSFAPHREIVRIADERHCGAIFMGVHGASPVGRFFFGSQTQKVLAETTVPVMLARGGMQRTKPAMASPMPMDEQV